MREWGFETPEMVDVDRQILAIDAEMVDATSLLRRYPLGLFQRSPLSREPVIFFKSNSSTSAGLAVAS